MTGIFLFSAIIGQDAMRKALILNAINPAIGGVLIIGEKGTAKSTAVRAFGACIKRDIVTLPLGITEDRLVGSIDIEKTMAEGRTAFQPGLLEKAHRGILYVDEVNLLQDHITDILLEVSANKVNRIQREGISYSHPSDFLLIGTMNMEEGPLRPHFLDRFGLAVYVESVKDPLVRMAIVKSRLEYEESQQSFSLKYSSLDGQFREKVERARELLPKVVPTDSDMLKIAEICIDANIDGHRGDLAMREAARAVAAWDGRTAITRDDLEEAAFFALMHRRQESPQQPQEQKQEDGDHKDENRQNQDHEPQNNPEDFDASGRQDPQQRRKENEAGEQERRPEDDGEKQRGKLPAGTKSKIFDTGSSYKVKNLAHEDDRKKRSSAGKRTASKSAVKSGSYLYSTEDNTGAGLALDATIRAAAPFQKLRERGDMAVRIMPQDIRNKVRQKKTANLLVFIVDSSGSMGALERMTETKAAVLSLLKDAYVKRDRIAMIVFRGEQARVVLMPTGSVQRGRRLLEIMETGGKTPLNDGLNKGYALIKNSLRKWPEILPMMIVITDGKGNVPVTKGMKPHQELLELGELIGRNKKINSLVIDIEADSMMKMGIARELAQRLHGAYMKVGALRKNTILATIEELK